MSRVKTLVKLGLASALAIGVFSAGLLGFNHLHLSATTSGIKILQPLTTATILPDFSPPPEFTQPSMNIVNTGWHGTMPTHYLSVEDAAKLVALYVWEVFDQSLEGRTIHMSPGSWGLSHRTYWRATVLSEARAATEYAHEQLLEEGIEFGSDEWMARIRRARENPAFEQYDPFTVTLDAITGERISITRNNYQHPRRCGTLTENEIMEALRNRSQALANDGPDPMVDLQLSQTQLDMFGEIASAKAMRHFGYNTAVQEPLLVNYLGLQPVASYARNSAGDVVFGNYLIPFYVADSAGRNVYVFISYTSRQILGMSTVSDSTAMLLPPVPFGTLLTYRPVAGGILSAYSWEITPPLWQPVPRQPAPISSFVSDEFVWPNLTVYEVRHTIGGAVLTNPWELIPAEDAAQYAAMYIWELFGMCIDGTAVEMSFSTSWEDMHIWQGVVLHEPCEATMAGALVSRSQECELFAFTINAVTGEMASIRRFYGAMPTSCYTITEEDWQQIREGITQVHYMHPEKEFGQAIEEYIRRMTKGGQPIRLAYQFSEPVVFERDENGSIIATVFHMYFDAHFVHHPTDEARRVVNLSIESETGKLAWMFVQR